MRTSIIIHTIGLCFLLFEGTAKAKPLTEVLGEYCVPTSGAYCSNAFAAKYDTDSNSCKCKNNTYLKYDSDERHCEVNCPGGHIALPTSACPNGYFPMMIVDHS